MSKPTHTYTIMTGYSADDLREMYAEARAMHLMCMLAGDKATARNWMQTAIDCAVTLHAITGGHEI